MRVLLAVRDRCAACVLISVVLSARCRKYFDLLLNDLGERGLI